MFFSHAVKVLLNLSTESAVRVGQSYASHKVRLNVPRCNYLPVEIISNLKDYDKQRKIIQNTPVLEKNIQRVFACEKFMRKNAIKNIILVIEGKKEELPLL